MVPNKGAIWSNTLRSPNFLKHRYCLMSNSIKGTKDMQYKNINVLQKLVRTSQVRSLTFLGIEQWYNRVTV